MTYITVVHPNILSDQQLKDQFDSHIQCLQMIRRLHTHCMKAAMRNQAVVMDEFRLVCGDVKYADLKMHNKIGAKWMLESWVAPLVAYTRSRQSNVYEFCLHPYFVYNRLNSIVCEMNREDRPIENKDWNSYRNEYYDLMTYFEGDKPVIRNVEQYIDDAIELMSLDKMLGHSYKGRVYNTDQFIWKFSDFYGCPVTLFER